MAFGSRKSYRPGQVVPKAGIYKVLHHGHRDPHEASLKADEVFPSCRHCGENVRFTLLRSVDPEDPENG